MNRVDLKVVLLGNSAVGKTSLVERFVNERFNEGLSYQNTIGAAFAAKQMQVNGKRLIMGIWDTAGSEKYDAMSRIYYRGAKAAVICYDITKSNTFQRAKFWIRELREVEEGCKIYICATKNDILAHGAVPSPNIDVVKTYTAGIRAKLFITSSKTGENLNCLMKLHKILCLIQIMYKKLKR
ncbi:ras-related protein Rab-24-like isoform X2 [Bombus bifarius]|uniref:Ras-related protein Rab-24-like isoform X2 n=1 Tax=Bombus bifarius TaxID=103933 RepID=A0A6P8LWV1_9HYME|nr:ras-related protein Rab-24-like isoform X2 [Bombus vancouverensis nearcticus]XP_033299928.1 ras-related protein Rab-24-like isoform X2 [Bombus bifarius]